MSQLPEFWRALEYHDLRKDGMASGCTLSNDHKHRYKLWRTWDSKLPKVGFIMLNPSTADHTLDDPTIKKCMAYARKWGYGGIIVVNLFGFRSTDPRALKKMKLGDAIGKHNAQYIFQVINTCELVVAAWGNDGSLHPSAKTLKHFNKVRVLGLTKSGHPKHPLYLKGDLKPIPWD